MSLNSKPDASPVALLQAMRPCLAKLPSGPVAVALSGGGDSVALTVLLKTWCDETDRELLAVTVDHGLRADSTTEARAAQSLCEGLGVGHTILNWQGWSQTGNLQDAARLARRRLIGSWAASRGIAAVALGHTLDDQAETFLMRLARGSGVDGLSAMNSMIRDHGLLWFRPMLGLRRETLRRFLRARKTPWSDDPSNLDRRFDRIRARDALETLATLGLSAERLSTTAAQMARARTALERATLALARQVATPGPLGDVVLTPTEFAAAPEEIRLRLLAAALQWVTRAPYRPRLRALAALDETISPDGLQQPATLHGCILRNIDGKIAIRREPGRTEGKIGISEALWDQRWLVASAENHSTGYQVGALGEAGLAQWPQWRDSGYDHEVLLTSPAIWDQAQLVSCAARDQDNTSPLCLKGGSRGFFEAIYMR